MGKHWELEIYHGSLEDVAQWSVQGMELDLGDYLSLRPAGRRRPHEWDRATGITVKWFNFLGKPQVMNFIL